MTLTDKGEIEWVQPNKETVELYRAGIYAHLMLNMDRVLTEEVTDERR